jgi:hypothetical protein
MGAKVTRTLADYFLARRARASPSRQMATNEGELATDLENPNVDHSWLLLEFGCGVQDQI